MEINTRSNDHISVHPIVREMTIKPHLEVRLARRAIEEARR